MLPPAVMQFDLKAHLFSLADSREAKELVADMIDNYAKTSGNKIDDRLAHGVRAALFDESEL